MWKLYIECFTKKYFDFKGRASRKEYWSFILFNSVIAFAIGFILGALLSFFATNFESEESYSKFVEKFSDVLGTLITIGTFFPSIGVTVRRARDINLSPLFILLSLLVILLLAYVLAILDSSNVIIITIFTLALFSFLYISLLLFFKKGDSNPNRYGNPT